MVETAVALPSSIPQPSVDIPGCLRGAAVTAPEPVFAWWKRIILAAAIGKGWVGDQ